MGKTIMSKVTNVSEVRNDSGVINAIKSILVYEDGLGARRKGYYVITGIGHNVNGVCVTHPSEYIEKLIIDLRERKNSQKVKEDAEIIFETESDNWEKYYLQKMSLQKI